MGQKVNPHGLRVGVIKDWDSRWYAEADFADNLVEDHKIRTFLKKKLYSAGALGFTLFIVGPLLAKHSATYRFSGFIWLLFSALATADSSNFLIKVEAYLGLYVTIPSAVFTSLPLMASNTKHAF